MHPITRRALVAPLAALAAAAVLAPAAMAHGQGGGDEVYVLSNQADGNAVLVYERGFDGSLRLEDSVPTGGLGTSGSLQSQGAVILDDSGRYVFAVNAGSDTISSFRVRRHGLQLVDVEPSGGVRPTSLTADGGLLYALNTGVPNAISGFKIRHDGELVPIPGSTRPLSADSTNPAQIGFRPGGDALVVTERATQLITSYRVGRDGRPGTPVSVASGGVTPYGFAFSGRDRLIVSDAGAPSGASSYRVGADGAVSTVTALLPNGQAAACWTVVGRSGRFAYTTNAATGNISGYRVARDGALSLLDPSGIAAVASGGPSDAAITGGGRYLYVRVNSSLSIDGFRVDERDGSLTPLGSTAGLPAGTAGIAAS